ncbi:MAG: hypothetical protein WC455_09270 [Dehalococcoidia bacterium]
MTEIEELVEQAREEIPSLHIKDDHEILLFALKYLVANADEAEEFLAEEDE